MFREIKNIEHQDGTKFRRWFQLPNLELLVWYKTASFDQIVLCEINFPDGLCLRFGGIHGVEFYRVDDGGDNPLKNQSPLLFHESLEKENLKMSKLKSILLAEEGLEPEIKKFILNYLERS